MKRRGADAVIAELERIGKIASKPEGRFSHEYQIFIGSEAWRIKRAERIKMDTKNGKVICQFCGKPIKKGEIEVDHRTYPPKGCSIQAFIDQPLDELQTLHHSCHKIKTRVSRKRR